MTTHLEPAREIPVTDEADVVVCGGGPAGIAAAIAAARTGAKTRLLEVHGCLGGVWTAGALSWIIDAGDKSGLMAELIATLDERGARAGGGRDFAYDVEAMKLVLDELALDAGVEVQLHTRVVAAECDANGRLRCVVTESKSGREAWVAPMIVDATGDGDVAAQSGCRFDYGDPVSGLAQPMSLMALLTGIELEAVRPFVAGGAGIDDFRTGFRAANERLLAELERAGTRPSYTGPTLLAIYGDLFALMANHEYGASALDASQITAATLKARAEVHRLVGALRAHGHPWGRLRLVATAAQIGVREGRRVHGLYRVTADDLRNGARHEDAVCRATFGADVHALSPSEGGYVSPLTTANARRTRAYDIPLRALIARDVDGLLLAGRCISGDFIAHSSYRVTGNAVAMGEAAGAAAALAAREGQLPQELPWNEVRAAIDAVAARPLRPS